MNEIASLPLFTTPRRFGGYFGKLFGTHLGWVGIDVGSVCLKLAQLEKTDDGFRFAAKWIIGEEEFFADDAAGKNPLERYHAELRAARRLFRRHATAAAASTSTTELRLLTLPLTDGDGLRAMAAEELLADCEDEAALRTDIWSVDRSPRQDSSIRVMAAGLISRVADGIGQGLRSAGFAPRVLDVAACAMARAVMITNTATPSAPTAAIDLGYSAATLCISIDGKPTFCRTLRDCGLRALLRPMTQRLGTSLGECRQILVRRGVPDDFDSGNQRSEAAYSLLAQGLERLAEELNRTLAFVRQELAHHRPERICLFGGGALIKNLSGFIAKRCGLSTAPWSLKSVEARDPLEPLFGIAAGLSAIAWEN